jgi:iron-sulfur cluster assembly accessory protein
MRFPPFAVTAAAIDELGRRGSIRVDLIESGCCGTAYSFEVERDTGGDEEFGCEGARLVVSPAAMSVLVGARLDYGAALKPPRFRVLANPNTPLRCPCNRSFGREWPGRGHPHCQSRTPMPWHQPGGCQSC